MRYPPSGLCAAWFPAMRSTQTEDEQSGPAGGCTRDRAHSSSDEGRVQRLEGANRG